MKHKISLSTWPMVFGSMLIAGLLAVGLLSAPVRADSGLPPRETPTPRPADRDDNTAGSPAGAHIELVAPGLPAGAWVAVQWQDSGGGWHDVEGWRGAAANSNRWWVHPKDFGTGPFRWVVRQGPGGAVLSTSAPFHLPGGANETLQVGMVAEP